MTLQSACAKHANKFNMSGFVLVSLELISSAEQRVCLLYRHWWMAIAGSLFSLHFHNYNEWKSRIVRGRKQAWINKHKSYHLQAGQIGSHKSYCDLSWVTFTGRSAFSCFFWLSVISYMLLFMSIICVRYWHRVLCSSFPSDRKLLETELECM